MHLCEVLYVVRAKQSKKCLNLEKDLDHTLDSTKSRSFILMFLNYVGYNKKQYLGEMTVWVYLAALMDVYSLGV